MKFKALLNEVIAICICLSVYVICVESAVGVRDQFTGDCGVSMQWRYNPVNCTLTIYGSGRMRDFSSSTVPWFSYRDSISTVLLPEGATSIGNSAFQECANLTTIVLPSSLESIGDAAFYHCTSLKSFTIPQQVSMISPLNVFGSCSSLESFYVDSANPNFTEVDGVLFNKERTILVACPAGKQGDYTIPDTVTTIGDFAFHGCQLSSVVIPNGVKVIGQSAFVFCSNIDSLRIPASVEKISQPVFDSLKGIEVDGNNEFFKSEDGVLFDKAGEVLYSYPARKSGGYIIPDSVQLIDNYAFYNCAYLNSVIIPNSVQSIGIHAFESCVALTQLTIPESVMFIGEAAFSLCSSLASIEVHKDNQKYRSEAGVLFESDKNKLVQYPCGKKDWKYIIPGDLDEIYSYAFYGNTNLKSIVIPHGISNIGDQAFGDCVNLEMVSFSGTADPKFDGIFDSNNKLHGICVPLGYQSFVFCGRRDFCKSEKCDLLENRCFQAECNNDQWYITKRNEAIEWEKRTNDCVEYFCENTTGLMSKSLCMNSEENACVDNRCVTKETKPNKKWQVNITVDHSDDLEEVDTVSIREIICSVAGIDCDDVDIEIIMDDDGHIDGVIVHIDNEEFARAIEEGVNNCANAFVQQ